MRTAGTRNTTVFTSDWHMNLDAPCSLLRNRKKIKRLTKFLGAIAARTDVAEVVILGDMVDQWRLPMDKEPQQIGFDAIFADPVNQPIVDALAAIAAHDQLRLTYVAGNHDSLAFLDENKQVLEGRFPGIRVCAVDPGLGHFEKDGVVLAEHGHRYCVFDAPDTWSHPGSHLPMGYFCQRMASTPGSAHRVQIFFQALSDQIKSYGCRSVLPPLVFNAFALYFGHARDETFSMCGFDGYDGAPTVAELRDAFADILRSWPERQNIISRTCAVVDHWGTLLFAAKKLIDDGSWFAFRPKIVVLGHTHGARCLQLPTGAIYANTGAWIDSCDGTWVEIAEEDDGADRSYTVTLRMYGEDEPIARYRWPRPPS